MSAIGPDHSWVWGVTALGQSLGKGDKLIHRQDRFQRNCQKSPGPKVKPGRQSATICTYEACHPCAPAPDEITQFFDGLRRDNSGTNGHS
jgi:hypothetical protein